MQSNISPTVDIIIEKEEKIVLIKRKNEPFKGKWAIPGGFIDKGETAEKAAEREAEEETSLKVKLKEILGVYSEPKRDPRRHIISTVFIAESIYGKLEGKTDAKEAKWFSIDDIPELAFDHLKIINDFKKWKKEKSTYWSSK